MKSETSFRVFFLKQHRKNSLKNIFFPSESVFLDFSFWPQGHRSSQNAHCALWNFVELCRTLWSSVACTDARRTETVNKAARLDHTAPNQCSITDFIESNMINDVYTLLSICSLRLQTLTPLLGRIFSSDIELALLNQASWKLFS